MRKFLTLSVLSYAISTTNTTLMALDPDPFYSQGLTPIRMTNLSSLILETIPEEILIQANLTPHDLSSIKAAKLIKLGLLIQSLPGEKLGGRSTEQKNEWIISCFFQAMQNLEDAQHHLPTADYFVEKIRRLIPPTVKNYVPADVILSSDITVDDSLDSLAFKLKTLGDIILNLDPTKLGTQAPFQKALAGHCFMYAGKKIENWIHQQGFQLTTNAAALEQAATLAQTYYQLAADNFNEKAALLMKKNIEELAKTIQAAKQHQLFSNIKTGFSNNHERQAITKGPSSNPAMKDVINELKSADHTSFIKQVNAEERVNPVRHFFPISAQNLSNETLAAVGLEAPDSPYKRAFKVSKLALNLCYSEPPSTKRDQIISDCYLLAGNNLIEAIRLQREKVQTQIAPELLMDTALSAAQFYTWAARHTTADNSSQIYQAANRACQSTVEAIINIPEDNYDWRVIGDKTLREVILINLTKIIRLFNF
ncbi:hypothetical protein [Candidatus Odyssella acanthamoebae]|uniref:Uncharacterized protein n=1 Tax=Candidatus Odyssella acanthamoebae TaxID=91604 RepID=A0A077AVT1_9PROT|nr:hypothetical protein [Candidatus Paracaedibacter acanthamoebae]AIK97257.1 hypothetical protein ID47_11725 [Candidatus Paracaedibacter acanthamoebae]